MSSETLTMIFDQYDEQGHGYLTKESFFQFLSELGRNDIPQNQLERCFAAVDLNHDGKITPKHFVQYVPLLYEFDFDPPPPKKMELLTPPLPPEPAGSKKKGKASQSKEDPAQIFTKLKKIGKGSYGQVFKAVDNRTGQLVALKIVDIEGSEDDVEDVQREVMFQAHCKSKYITEYFASFLRGTQLWIAMEFVGGGSCLDLLKSGVFPEHYVRIIVREMLKGLQYLHSEGKFHRDIKAGNVLLADNGDIKLADFGVAAQIYQTVANKFTFAGTPLWMAPEIIKQQPQSFTVDIWSLGITCIEFAKGQPPKADLHPMQVLFSVPDDPPPELEGEFSIDFKNFVATCLKKEPNERPSATDLLKHPFIDNESPTSCLAELINRHHRWQKLQGNTNDDEEEVATSEEPKETGEFWDFGERRNSAAGQLKKPIVYESDESDENDEANNIDDELNARLFGGSQQPKAKQKAGAEQQCDPSLLELLERFGLEQYAQTFAENDVDLDAFLMLEDQDLADLNVKLGSRKKMVSMIKSVRANESSDHGKNGAADSPDHSSEHIDGAKSDGKPAEAAANGGEANGGEGNGEETTVPRPQDPNQWSVAHVAQWMTENGFGDHSAEFVKNKITGAVLLLLELSSLKELGLELVGDRVRFRALVDGMIEEKKKREREAERKATSPTSARKSMYHISPSPPNSALGSGQKAAAESSSAGSVSSKSSSSASKSSIASSSSDESMSPTGTVRKSSLFKGKSLMNSIRRKAPPSDSSQKQRDLQAALAQMQAKKDATAGAQVERKKSVSGAQFELPTPDITADELRDVDHSGWLLKQGGSRKNWKKRWMVLKDCVLYYFPAPKGAKAKGAIMLPSYGMWIAGETKKKYCFKAQHPNARTYYFQAANYEDMKKWMTVMHIATQALTQTNVNVSIVDGRSVSETKAANKKKDNRTSMVSDPFQTFCDVIVGVDPAELRPYFDRAGGVVEQAITDYYKYNRK